VFEQFAVVPVRRTQTGDELLDPRRFGRVAVPILEVDVVDDRRQPPYDGIAGALAATAGIFTPAIIFTVILTPIFARFGNDPRVKGFIKGITIAVVGVLSAMAPLLASSAITDVTTAVMLLASLGLLATKRVPEPMVVALGALAGIAAGWSAA
jgi:chromate transport protein ChrA